MQIPIFFLPLPSSIEPLALSTCDTSFGKDDEARKISPSGSALSRPVLQLTVFPKVLIGSVMESDAFSQMQNGKCA